MRCHPELTSDQIKSNSHGVFPDQNYRVWDLVLAHISMIRGHFGLGMVWSEVTSVWGWYDQRSLQDGKGLIRGGFKRTLIWSENNSSWFFFIFWFFIERCWLNREEKKQHSDQRNIWGLMVLIRTKGVQLRENASPL